MLNTWLGSGGQSGGLNPLYQIGGPRSILLALNFASKHLASRLGLPGPEEALGRQLI